MILIARAMADADVAMLTASQALDGNSRRPGPKNTGLGNMEPRLRRDDGREGSGAGAFVRRLGMLLEGKS